MDLSSGTYPFLTHVMSVIIFLIDPVNADPIRRDESTLITLERGWHADLVHFIQIQLPQIAVILVVAFVLSRLVHFFVGRMKKLADRQVGNAQRAAQLRTIAAILRATAYAVIGFIVLLNVLSTFNINLTPLLASAGVVGVGIGLGAQSIFKDMLNGIFILIEDQYNVGEWIKIAGLTGQVEDLSLRCTILRDGDGTLYTIPNSSITTVSNLSRDFSVASLSVSVDATEDPARVITILNKIAQEVRQDPAFKQVILADPDPTAVDKISGHEIIFPINVKVRANQKDGVLRELRLRIIQAFAKEKIALGTSASTLIMRNGTQVPSENDPNSSHTTAGPGETQPDQTSQTATANSQMAAAEQIVKR